MTEQSRTYFK